MFVGVELDPESGSINNKGSVFVEYNIKMAIKHMKKHLKAVLEERENLMGVNAYIIDAEAQKIVCDLVVSGTADKGKAQLQAAVSPGYDDNILFEYFDGIKKTFNDYEVEVFGKWKWKE
jgi:hypothetical protein